MAAKLTEITTQYHTFVDNQVLTEKQLNEFISYFEDQDRLSRIFLSGVGIVCGFELTYNASKPSITITQGAGITTDGDLINLRTTTDSGLKSIDLDSIEFSSVKKFEDNFANYRFFKRLENVDGNLKEVPLEMWELVPEDTENASKLSSLKVLQDKAVLLYLESYAKEGDLCTSIDCDNQGVEQVARLRVLLVSKSDVEYIIGLDSIFSKHNVIDTVFNLPEVAVRRVILNSLNSASYDELKRSYYKALNDNNVTSELTKGISQIVSEFSSILQLNISKTSLKIYFSKLKDIAGFSAYNVPFDVQYRYDCIKDLVDTYNEIKALLLSLKEECCPDIKAFPKHVLLGSIDEIQSEIKHFRHAFYKSPLHHCGAGKLQQCRSLVLKWFQQIVQFNTLVGETKITPSNKLPELSFRSIPFYYNLKEDFLTKWNYFKTEEHKEDTNLSYHTSLLSSAPHIQEPMFYNIDNFDFYRIEGHQGKDYQQVMEELDALKTKYGVSFDVKALSVNINTENLNIDDYECEFEDLNVLLQAWTAEQECILAEVSGFFSGFSMVDPGKNLSKSFATRQISGLNLNITDTAFNTGGMAGNVRINKPTGATSSASGDYTYGATKYTKDSVVTDNLNTNEKALGSVMKVALDQTIGGSVNDIIAKADTLVNEKLDPEVWANQPQVKAFVIDRSIEMMAYSHILINKMPGLLVDVSIDKVDTYKLTLKDLCARVEAMKTTYQNIELSAELKAFMGILITQLSTICCSGKKLQVLLEEINKRKESILVRLQLSKFVEKHPGLEHKAGVEPGGTFVLVYLNKKVVLQPPSKDLGGLVGRIPVNIGNNINIGNNFNIGRSVEPTVNLVKSASTAFMESPIRNISIADSLGRIPNLELLNQFTKLTDLPNNTVIADFALPYMCCSDCSPVNFIVQRPPVSLRLEKDQFCLGQDTSPLLFEVSPADGVIKPDEDVAGLTIDGKKLTLDPETFPDEMIGKVIHFTVNEQITNCEITVYRGVQFDFEVPESPTSETEITFVPTGKLEGATFLWSFGDDNLSTERNPTHKYALPVNDANKVTVSLTVTAANGVCQSTVEHEIEFRVEPTKISLDKTNYCENDRSNYPFGISPAGAKAVIEGPGVQKDANGNYVFVPAAAGVGTYEFKLNGDLSGLKVTVNEAPVPQFNPDQMGNTLIIANNSTGADSYVWLINGDKIERADNSQITIELTANSPTEWRIQLQAISKNCGTVTSKEVIFNTKFIPEQPVNTCVDDTRKAISADLEALAKLDMPTSEMVHSIWLDTSQLYGGAPNFTRGVLNDFENFLTGKRNKDLQTMFEKPLNTSAKQLTTLNPAENKEEFNNVLQLFRLQLQLFYNVLGCQSADTVKASADMIQPLLDLIIRLLKLLRESQVKMPAALQEFIKAYATKVEKVPMLADHIKVITDSNLI